jgi:hypothetical protein
MAVEQNILQFNAPIPGQSLTTEQKARPWENPPKYNTEEDALDFYMSQLEVPERIEHLFQLLDAGLPVADLVDTITLSGVMEGLHTIDIAVLISPALFTLITGMADAAGIDYKDGIQEEDDGRMSEHTIQMAEKRHKAQELVEQVEDTELEGIQESAMSTVGLMSRSDDVTEENIEE